MARCSNCGKVSNTSQLKGGYCPSCKPELFSKITEPKDEDIQAPQNIQNKTEIKKDNNLLDGDGLGWSALIAIIVTLFTMTFLGIIKV